MHRYIYASSLPSLAKQATCALDEYQSYARNWSYNIRWRMDRKNGSWIFIFQIEYIYIYIPPLLKIYNKFINLEIEVERIGKKSLEN